MARFELQPNCLFVDAFNLDNLDLGKLQRFPTDIPKAHIMDKRQADNITYLELDDVAAFITRFIVQGVETECLLPQIVASEYSLPVAAAAQEVQAVVTSLHNYLRPRQSVRPYEKVSRFEQLSPESSEPENLLKAHDGVYDLDFRVNLLFLGGFKLPL